jgi:hypothetical protein
MRGNKEEKMATRYLIAIGLIAVLVGACTSARKFSDKGKPDWGTSYEMAKSNQILNPEAGRNLEPVKGFDGDAALITVEKYREDFTRPPPTDVYSISIGSISQGR